MQFTDSGVDFLNPETPETHLLFLPQHHLDPIHRHHNADLLLLDVLGLEFILGKTDKKQYIRTVALNTKGILSFLYEIS